ncbi:MAG: hypothetical protein WC307_06130 [Candidatus Nanoarchaeia archaeon]|jgi:hypothetical protein
MRKKSGCNHRGLTPLGVKVMDSLLSSPLVDDYHKTLLKSSKDLALKKALNQPDLWLFDSICETYKELINNESIY